MELSKLDNSIYIAGCFKSSGFVSSSLNVCDITFFKISDSAVIQWARTMGGNSNDAPTNIHLTKNEEVMVMCGYIASTGFVSQPG